MKEKISNYSKGFIFYTILLIGFLVVGATDTYAAWTLESADGKLRQAGGIILFIIAAFMAIKAYAKGRKGLAVTEILVGAFLGIFINSSDPLKSLSEFFKGLLGF